LLVSRSSTDLEMSSSGVRSEGMESRQRGMRILCRPASRGAAVLSLLLALACGGPGEAPPADAVVTYKGGFVTAADVETLAPVIAASDMKADAADQGSTDPTVALATRIALFKALAAEAPDDDPELAKALAAGRERVLRDAMLARLGFDRITVTEEEMRAQYDGHPEQYHDPERLRIQHIYLRCEESTSTPQEREAVRREMEEIRRQILAGADFSAMARQHSQSDDANSGGWTALKPGAPVLRSFSEAAWSLEIDEVSDVVESPNGFHLIKLRERTPPIDRPFENVAEFVRRRVVADKAMQITNDFIRQAGERHGLITSYERLDDPAVAGDEPLIVIGDFRFTFDDLVKHVPPEIEEHLFNHYPPKIHRFLETVVRDRLLLFEADRTSLADDPQVAATLRATEFGARANRALAERLEARADEVPEDHLREFFWQNEQRYQTLRETDLSIILLLPQDGEPLFATLKRGEALAEQIRAGASFEDLARRESRHYSAANGGRMAAMTDHDIAHRLQSTAKFRRALDQLAVGEVSKPMVAECYDGDELRFIPTGIVFVRKNGEKPPEQQSFETVRDLVRWNYLRRHYTELELEVLLQLQNEIGLRINSANLPRM
jgi:parvulin-like peptidyl-prolyl isomerase